MTGKESPEARPGEVEFTLRWRGESGALRGELEARNVCRHSVRLSDKPRLIPLGEDGEPLEVKSIVTLEMRLPGYVELAPGERAQARVGWGGWDGPPASGRVVVAWDGGRVEVTADGPHQPESGGPATNLSSSWFERVG